MGDTTKFRIGVSGPHTAGVTLWHDMETPGDAHAAYQLLHDHGRDDITVVMEWLDPDGHWLPVPVRTYGRADQGLAPGPEPTRRVGWQT